MDLKKIYQENEYEKICSFWEEHQKEEDKSPLPEWDYVYMMNSFYKLKQYDECLNIYREFHKAYPQSELIDDKMGWAVYHVCLKNHDFKKDDNGLYLKQVDYILRHCRQKKYSPVPMVIKHAVNAILNGNLGSPIDFQRAHDYLKKLNPEKLSCAERLVSLKNGENHKVASEQEKWYTLMCKVLLKLNQHEKCISCCEQAFSHIYHFHNNNDFWLRRLEIRAQLHLGRIADAKDNLNLLLMNSFHPWTLYELGFQVAAAENNQESALKYIGSCALTDSKHEMRVKFYEQSADFLYQHGYERIAMLQEHLVDLIRQKKEWKTQVHHHQWQVSDEIVEFDENATMEELKTFWKEQRDKGKVFQEGTVKTILPPGRSGFISGQTGKDYYFSFSDVNGDRRQIKEGTHVRFTLMKKMDHKRNQPSDNAVEITII